VGARHWLARVAVAVREKGCWREKLGRGERVGVREAQNGARGRGVQCGPACSACVRIGRAMVVGKMGLASGAGVSVAAHAR
jgi:hypothetical protein